MSFTIIDNVLKNYSGMDEEVVIPEGVVEIGCAAFRDMLHAKAIRLPKTLKKIGSSVLSRGIFGRNYQLEKVIVPDLETWLNIDFDDESSNLLIVGKNLYVNDLLVTSVTIDNCEKIKKYAFANCQSLEKVVVAEGVKEIETAAFYHSSIKEISLPDSLEKFGGSSLYGCGVFSRCDKLKEIKIPRKIERLPADLFDCCSSLRSISLSNGLVAIEDMALNGLENLKELYIPDSVTKIERIGDLQSLENIRIPSDLDNTESLVLDLANYKNYNQYQSGLYVGNEFNPYLVFVKPTEDASFENFVFHPDTKYICGHAFVNLDQLVELALPSNVKKAFKNAFVGCKNLKTVRSDGDCAIEESCFDSCDNVCLEGGLLNKEFSVCLDESCDSFKKVESRYDIQLKYSYFSDCYNVHIASQSKYTLTDDREVQEVFRYNRDFKKEDILALLDLLRKSKCDQHSALRVRLIDEKEFVNVTVSDEIVNKIHSLTANNDRLKSCHRI